MMTNDDLGPLFATPQIETAPDGRHWGAEGREYRAVEVDGEITYEPIPDHTAVVELARQRRDRDRAISDYYVSRDQATLSAIDLAVRDVDGTGRRATDVELAEIVRVLLSDQS